uniref:Uncharacterized protein n=1 Tax=Caenorhabditis tropicalis TaxID=1561998 RepID=A0A1I7TXE1_9PELO
MIFSNKTVSPLNYCQYEYHMTNGCSYTIAAFSMMICVFFYRIAEIKTQSRVQEMSESINDLMMEHEEELNIERRRISAHCLKLKMQKRDYMAQMGSLQRKLREQQELVKSLNSKIGLSEENVKQLSDKLIRSTQIIKQKDELIESLKSQLNIYESKEEEREKISDIVQSVEFEVEEDKENSILKNERNN